MVHAPLTCVFRTTHAEAVDTPETRYAKTPDGSGLEFEERGEHELKGVPGKWGIYAVQS